MISFILILATIAAAVLAVIFVKPKPNTTKKQQTNVINNYIERYNQLVRQYNRTNDKYLIEAQKIERKIVICNDFESQGKFETIILNYEKSCNVANDYLKRGCNCLDNKDFAGATYCMDELENAINEMDTHIASFNHITPKMSGFEQTAPKRTAEETSSFQFFIGCNSKEEADVRYRSLAKAFHPDSKGGDEAMFLRMQKEYESLQW